MLYVYDMCRLLMFTKVSSLPVATLRMLEGRRLLLLMLRAYILMLLAQLLRTQLLKLLPTLLRWILLTTAGINITLLRWLSEEVLCL